MIKVTRLNGKELYINCEHIEFVESTPDTIITLFNEKKVIVSENVEQVVTKIINYKSKVTALPLADKIYRDEV